MRRQIAVRLPEDPVAFVDDVVATGRDRSRAAVVTRASAAAMLVLSVRAWGYRSRGMDDR